MALKGTSDAAIVTLVPFSAITFVPFAQSQKLGRFAIRDFFQTVGVGVMRAGMTVSTTAVPKAKFLLESIQMFGRSLRMAGIAVVSFVCFFCLF